jgi:hypothetical protein
LGNVAEDRFPLHHFTSENVNKEIIFFSHWKLFQLLFDLLLTERKSNELFFQWRNFSSAAPEISLKMWAENGIIARECHMVKYFSTWSTERWYLLSNYTPTPHVTCTHNYNMSCWFFLFFFLSLHVDFFFPPRRKSNYLNYWVNCLFQTFFHACISITARTATMYSHYNFHLHRLKILWKIFTFKFGIIP